MPASNPFLLDRRNPIQVGDQFSAQQMHGIITLVPDAANVARQWGNQLSPDVYRQELRMIVATPTVERRINRTAAAIRNATLESRLDSRLVNDVLIALILALFMSAAVIGIVIGAGFAQAVVPPDLLTLGFIVTVGLSIFVLGAGLGAVAWEFVSR